MPYRDIIKDTTSFIGKVFLRDSTTGLGKTGVSSASMSGDYCKDNNSADVALSFSAGTVGDSYSSGKWAEIGNGYYFYHYPNACWDTYGETGFSFRASGAIDAAPKYRVVAMDSEDAIRAGLTALPNAAADAPGGLPISDAGGLDLDARLDVSIGSRMASFSLPANFADLAITSSTGRVTVGTNADKTGYNLAADQSGVTIGTVTTNTDMRGTDGAALASVWTPTRGGYVDNLSAGAVATQASVDTLTNAVRNQISVPTEYQLPSSGSERFKITVLTYDASGTLNDPDANTITLTVENAVGTSRSGNLYDASSGGSATTTMTRVGAGQYVLWYEIDAADAEEQLNWLADYDESASRMLGTAVTTTVAISSGGGFNSGDRTKLEAAYNKLPTALYLLGSANADGSGYATSSLQSSHTSTLSSILNTVGAVVLDTNELQTDWANGGRLDLLLDAAATQASVDALNDIAVSDIWTAFNSSQLAKFATVDTGETTAADGSVAKIAQGSAGGNVTVGAMTQAALAQFATDDTGETTAAAGSVAKLSEGSGVTPVVLPAAVSIPDRSSVESIPLFIGETIQVSMNVFEVDGTTPVDISGEELVIVIESNSGADVAIIDDANITVGGADNNVLSFNIPQSVTTQVRVLSYAVRRVSDRYVFARGNFNVRKAAEVDA